MRQEDVVNKNDSACEETTNDLKGLKAAMQQKRQARSGRTSGLDYCRLVAFKTKAVISRDVSVGLVTHKRPVLHCCSFPGLGTVNCTCEEWDGADVKWRENRVLELTKEMCGILKLVLSGVISGAVSSTSEGNSTWTVSFMSMWTCQMSVKCGIISSQNINSTELKSVLFQSAFYYLHISYCDWMCHGVIVIFLNIY